MLPKSIIVKLDSNNVSIDPALTKKRFGDIWLAATNSQKNEAANLGGYKDARSLTNAKNAGKVSVRMVVALSIVFNVDPRYLTAEVSEKGAVSKERLEEFIAAHGLEQHLSQTCTEVTEDELVEFVRQALISSDGEPAALSNEEYVTLLESYLIRDRLRSSNRTDSIRVTLLKILLTSN